MAKVKTTISLDEDLLRAARVLAARKGMRHSEVLELSLRRLLGLDVLDQMWARNAQVSADTASLVAYEELQAQRAGR